MLVKADVGTYEHTPLVFSIPIPNGFAVVRQTSGHATSAKSSYTVSDCTTDACNPIRGEAVETDQPWHQVVTGTIQVYPTQKDILGNQADEPTKKAMAADVRVAGVALLGFAKADQDVEKPVIPGTSTLQLNGSEVRSWVYLRQAKDPDEPVVPAPPVDFTADIDLHDFYFPSALDPTGDRASASVFLAVWTTAGGLQITPLLLWPVLGGKVASEVASANKCVEASSFVYNGDWSGLFEPGRKIDSVVGPLFTRSTLNARRALQIRLAATMKCGVTAPCMAR